MISFRKFRLHNLDYFIFYLNSNVEHVAYYFNNNFVKNERILPSVEVKKLSSIEKVNFKKYLVVNRLLPIYTSYFAYYKGGRGISIANSQPKNCNYEIYKPLVPDWKLVTKFKSDNDEEYFIKSYINTTLKNLDPVKVYKDLNCKVLLCWEHPKYFCHRKIVAKWLNKKLGINVTEYKKVNKQNSLW